MTEEEAMTLLREKLSVFEKVNSAEAIKLARWALYRKNQLGFRQGEMFKLLWWCEKAITDGPAQPFEARLRSVEDKVDFLIANPEWLPGNPYP